MPSPDRCPRCDRAECPWHLLPDPDSDDDRALFSADRARADANCRAHELTIEQWRAEALALRARVTAADRLQAEESERAALLADFVNTIGARIGAREHGYGAQSIEAGEARYRAGIMKRLDELLAAEARLASPPTPHAWVIYVGDEERDLIHAEGNDGYIAKVMDRYGPTARKVPLYLAASPPADARTWSDGVRDAIKCVQGRRQIAEILAYAPAYFAALDEVLVFLEAGLERGTMRSTSRVDGTDGPDETAALAGKDGAA